MRFIGWNMLVREICLNAPFNETTRRLLTIPGSGCEAVNIAPFHVAAHGLLGEMTADEFKSAIGISAKTDTSGSVGMRKAIILRAVEREVATGTRTTQAM